MEDVLARPGEVPLERDGGRLTLGQTRAGRSLEVIYLPGTRRDTLFLIAPFERKGNPLTVFRRHTRRRRT